MAMGTIEYLYDAAKSNSKKDEYGMPVLDQQKLERELTNNRRLMASNKEMFAEFEPKFHTCLRYKPCPICYKCKNKASHLFKACETCKISTCTHSYSDMAKMIRRENFVQYVTEDVYEAIEQISEEVKK